MATESEREQQSGKLVALEGDTDAISTQLRLLPPSQKILILPALLDNIPEETNQRSFNARTYVRAVHNAFTERIESARSFLRSSTSAQPRLVFMNGGSVSARTTCIARICENVTNRDVGEAETIFNEIVKDGLHGLMRHDEAVGGDVQMESNHVLGEEGKVEDTTEDPTLKAMKAADSLDLETAALVSGKGLTLGQREDDAIGNLQNGENAHARREKSLVHDESLIEKGDIFTTQQGDTIVTTVLTFPSRGRALREKRTTFGTCYTPNTPTTDFIHQTGDLDDHEFDQGTDGTAPSTPAVVYGEACLVDVKSTSPERPVKRTQSIGRFNPSDSKFLDLPFGPHLLKQTRSAYSLRARPKTSDVMRQKSYEGYQMLPRSTFVRASKTTIRKSPTTGSARSASSSTREANARVFVDRGTDAVDIGVIEDTFEPVFPLVEDLIIHFADNRPNRLLEFVIRNYKNGKYPVVPASLPNSEYSSPNESPISSKSPSTPRSTHDLRNGLRPILHMTTETDDTSYAGGHDFDPYAAHDNSPPDIRQWPPRKILLRVENAVETFEPPTPTTTLLRIGDKFVELPSIDSGNAIHTQDSLRQALGVHFPAGWENGFSQYYYPVAPEIDRLWKPVFRNDYSITVGIGGRTVDQIIALGCEDGVKKDFFFQVSGQVERLGTKRDGLSRSGKFDIRYLIANVMQQFSSLPLTAQSVFKPRLNPTLLAILLVPQIEAYLASNTSIHLLILHFPEKHLATILALRKLLGSGLLNVAGILDSLASDPPPMSRPHTPITANPLSNEAISSRNKRHNSFKHTRTSSITTLQGQAALAGSVRTAIAAKPDSSISFAKADFLLPSTATDSEITTFLSGIWKVLMDKSSFYIPEPEPKPVLIEEPPVPPTPAPTPSSTRDRDDAYSSVSYRGMKSKISRLTGSTANSPRYPPSTTTSRREYAPSVAPSTKTTASEKERKADREWENFYIGEEDSDDDAYDKMIMGRSMARIVPEVRKGGMSAPQRNKKKALKWLGLA